MAEKSLAEIISQSHNYCSASGLKPTHTIPTKQVDDETNTAEQSQIKELLSHSNAIIKEYFQPGDKSSVILTDANCRILLVSSTTKGAATNFELAKNSTLSEESTGTNAFALAAKEKQHICITGNQHYLNLLHGCTTIATPIFNYNNRLIGIIGVLHLNINTEEHTQSMVKMAANAIADKYWNKLYQKKLNDERQLAFNIMNNLSYGLFAINLNEKIHWVNDTACRSLNIRRTSLLRINITDIIPGWKEIKHLLDSDKRLTDEEFTLNINKQDEKYILNAYTVKDLNNKIVGYVITLRPFSRMIKMLGRYSLNNSYFTFSNIIGKSDALKHAIKIAKTAANSPSTILISGESGTGKEVFAQAIHNQSRCKENNFVAINCGAISSSLIESELFGYEEGAFTGALKKGRPGKFELADKGTIFLDEIAEMPLEMQVKLLRAIQEKSITRVGGSKEIAIDVRIIAATNKDLREEMSKGTFRSDLFYRLSVIPIHLPSLKQRPEDIPELIQFFLKQKGQLLTKPIPELSTDTMNQLKKYHWPGNVRELENTMEKLVLFDGQLPLDVTETSSESNLVEPTDKQSEIVEFAPTSLEHSEKEVIANTLNYFNWNISKCASSLGIGRNTLYDKIKKHQIQK